MNPLKGEVGLTAILKGEAGAADRELNLILVYDDEAIVALENELDMSVLEFPNLISGVPRFGTVRVLLWGGLLRHQPKMTVADAGAVVKAAGIPDALGAISTALAAAFPQPGDAEAPANPQKAPAKPRKVGTGRRSTASGSNSGSAAPTSSGGIPPAP